jgi:hypothetical protein
MKRVSGPSTPASNAGDVALDAVPALGAVEELLTAHLAVLRRSLEARLRADLEALDMAAQGRVSATPRMQSRPSLDTSQESRDSDCM